MDSYIENSGFEDYSERIFSAYHYYSLGPKLNNTYRVVLQLEAEVDGAILTDAVRSTMQRYPYLLVKRENTFRETKLCYNPAPVVVRQGDLPIDLGCAASNGHMLAFTYEGDKIYLNGFHGLLDGAGVYLVIKTLLYYYCKAAFDPTLSTEGVRVVGDPIPPEEYTDPFPRKIPKGCRALSKRPLFQSAFHIKDDRRVHTGEKFRCRIKIDESELMKFCRVNDGSPAVLVSVVLSRAIARLNPDAKRPILAGIALNLRPAFDAPLAHHSLTDILSLEFTKKLQSHSFEMQNTAFRSQVFLKSDRETVLKNLAFAGKTFVIMQAVPSLALKRLVFGTAVPSQYCANTFMLSYVGKADYGAAQKYVRALRIDLDTPDIGIAVEISAIRGQFFIDFMVDFPEDIYIKAFCDELESLGIACECGEMKPLLTPKCTY